RPSKQAVFQRLSRKMHPKSRATRPAMLLMVRQTLSVCLASSEMFGNGVSNLNALIPTNQKLIPVSGSANGNSASLEEAATTANQTMHALHYAARILQSSETPISAFGRR